jgi:hypothetical protein
MPRDPGGEHDLWLAMQAAHHRYKNASATLDALTSVPIVGGVPPECKFEIQKAVAEQRAAFEDYIDARLDLSESMSSRPAVPATAESEDRAHASRHLLVSRTALFALAVAALFPAAFSAGYLARQTKLVRDLEAARDQANTMLAQMKEKVDVLARKIEISPPANPVPVKRAAVRILRKPVRRRAKITKTAQATPQPQIGARNYYNFTLTPSRYTQRIGSIKLTALKVEPSRQYLDVSIAVDNLAPHRERISLHEPVWIDLGGRAKAVELMVDRIDGGRVEGYLATRGPLT